MTVLYTGTTLDFSSTDLILTFSVSSYGPDPLLHRIALCRKAS